MNTQNRVKSIVTGAVLTAGLVVTAAAQNMTPMGIYLDNSSPKIAVKFNVELSEADRKRTVPTTYHFVDGDRMKFQFEVNHDAYIYVLHRTIDGDPESNARYAGAKGIDVIRDDDRAGRAPGRYRLLFPNKQSGSANKLTAHKMYAVPFTQSYFVLDNKPGIEKLLVVASSKPLDLTQYFDMETGNMNGGSSRQGRQDTDQDVRDRLGKQLASYASNADVAQAKGIDIVDGYASAGDAGKPMLLLVDLNHYTRQ